MFSYVLLDSLEKNINVNKEIYRVKMAVFSVLRAIFYVSKPLSQLLQSDSFFSVPKLRNFTNCSLFQHTWNFSHTLAFLSKLFTHRTKGIYVFVCGADNLISFRIHFTPCCTFVPCHGQVYLLELKAAVADLSMHCC